MNIYSKERTHNFMLYKLLFIISIFLYFVFYTNIYASDLEFSQDAFNNRKDVKVTDEYKIEDSLIEEYGVEDIFTEKDSSMEEKYTAEGLFEEESQQVSLVSGEFDDIFIEDISYHEMYESEKKTNLIYKIILVIFVVIITYFLTNIYLLMHQRRRNAKNKNRA